MYNKGHIHFIGIGGIGMSGIAKILKYQGYRISGCDADLEQKSIKELQLLGCAIFQGNNTEHCQDKTIDTVVYSSAIKFSNPELIAAQNRGIPTIGRALMLAELMRTKYSIAISGSHGKTTTTSLTSHILIEAKKDPTVIVGGHLQNLSTNAHFGLGDFLVAEADESDRSFLRLYPTIAVVTNIDFEHVDTYTNLNDVKHTFKQFLANIPFYGKAIICIDDPNIQSILPLSHIKTFKYAIDNTSADLYAFNIKLDPDSSTFDIYLAGSQKTYTNITVPMPGKHNVLNTLAAIAVAYDLGVDLSQVSKYLTSFRGIDRRFSFKQKYKEAEIFDDYAHHPTEIYYALAIAKKRAKKNLCVIFQPHRYSRTEQLWDDFLNIFAYSSIDKLIITDIYPASEKPRVNVTSQNFVTAFKQKYPCFPVDYVPYDHEFKSLKKHIDTYIQPDDLILLLGAGKLNNITQYL